MSEFHNRTRRSASIPRRLLREGRPHLIPLYYLLRTSELAREGIENSGSYRFADHIYEGKPRGRYGVGRVLDAVLLQLKSAQSLRARYEYAKREILPVILSHAAAGIRTEVLAVPCGLGRELFELSDELRQRDPALLSMVGFHGMDLDGELVKQLRQKGRDLNVDITFWSGDALKAESYPRRFDVILSTGFTEFLEDQQVLDFYTIAREHLKLSGHFITSGLARHAPSDFLLRNLAELHTNYRTEAELRLLADEAGFRIVSTYQNPHRLQTMLVAVNC